MLSTRTNPSRLRRRVLIMFQAKTQMKSIVLLLSEMLSRGIRVWADNGRLHYHGPPGSVTLQDVEILRQRKPEITHFLERSNRYIADLPIHPRNPTDPIPLSFLQESLLLAATMTGLSRNTRSLANAIRISGSLDHDVLAYCFDELVKRHEILRSRIIKNPHGVMQEITDTPGHSLEIVDLTRSTVSASQAQLQLVIEELVDQHCDPTVGPLVAARLVRVSPHDHVLVIAIDHIIGDAQSMGILSRDLWSIYLQAIRRLPRSLPDIPLQFPDFAVWQRRTDVDWMKNHGQYWRKRLRGASHTRLTVPDGSSDCTRLRATHTPIKIRRTLTEGLRELARRESTTLVMTVLAAYIAAVSRWTNERDITVGFVRSGRTRPELDNTVGPFSFTLYLRVEVRECDTFIDLLHRVTREYRDACEHEDGGRMALQWQTAAYTKNTSFNWKPRARTVFRENSGKAELRQSSGNGVRVKPFPFKKAAADTEWDERVAAVDVEPGVILSESADGISGLLWYREDRASFKTMESFVENFGLVAQATVANPHARVSEQMVGMVCRLSDEPS